MDYAKVVELITHFMRRELQGAQRTDLVVGISGGIDSAVSAELAIRAIGKENVWGYWLPYKHSNSYWSELLAEHWCMKLMQLDITPQIDAYFDDLAPEDISSVRIGNKCARERMSVLYDMSEAHNALVLGTGNKTEAYLGYTTIWGDMACAFSPIGDLYKFEVWEMAEYLGIPQEVIDRVPSADLWEGQTDEGELGISYEEADKIIQYIIEGKKSGAIDEDKLQLVQDLHSKTMFKRRMPHSIALRQFRGE